MKLCLIICCLLMLCGGGGCVVAPKDELAEFPGFLAKILNESPLDHDAIGEIMSRDFVRMGGRRVGRIGGEVFAYEFKNCVVFGTLGSCAGVFSKKEINQVIQEFDNYRNHLIGILKTSPWHALKIAEAEYEWEKEIIADCPPRPDSKYLLDIVCQRDPPGTYLRSESILLVVGGNQLCAISARLKPNISVPPKVKREDLLRGGKYAVWSDQGTKYPEAARPSRR